ncbi:MinD/ParA family protein [Streptomyces sp. NPDC051664]|uniref:MinD/ParA family protein n=1 Tax=Streptomyces sp. NPDC051664 TaxID=3365668 RepID=UPI0037B9424F
MALIALVSAASDGVTTSAAAMALASPRPVLLAEFDLAGGKLRNRLLRGVQRSGRPLDGHIGLHKLAEAYWGNSGTSSFTPQVAQHLWPLDDTDYRFVLPGLTDPRQAASLREVWPSLVNVLQLTDHELGWDVIVDGGRVVLEGGRPHPVLSPVAVLHEADIVLLVVRMADEASVLLASSMIEALQDELSRHGTGARALGLLAIGNGERHEFSVDQVARELQAPVLATLRWDPRAAAYIQGGGPAPRGLSRSVLLRSARDVIGPLHEYAQRRRIQLQLRAAQAANPGVMQQVRQLGLIRQQGAGRG